MLGYTYALGSDTPGHKKAGCKKEVGESAEGEESPFISRLN